jgi:hypothetical protein
MSHEAVGQLQLQSALIKKYLELVKPRCAMFVGIAGGNGLEHIDTNVTKEVFGIDINSQYLDITKQRFGSMIHPLDLQCIDLTKSCPSACKADLVWASLIVEYIGIENAMRFFKKNTAVNAHVLITIQCDNGSHTVSETGIVTLKKLSGVFTNVDEAALEKSMSGSGFECRGVEENFLAGGKSLKTFHYLKK